ncbi:MAG: phospholipase D-like domain-containing protein [Nitrospirota bacterium]
MDTNILHTTAKEPAPTFTIHSIESIFKSRFSVATSVQLLWKGKDSFDTIFDAVKKAERLICLEFYIFRNDETGNELAEILKQKSREGVRVYVLYDHFGSLGTPRRFWKDLKAAGVNVRASRPFKWTAPSGYVHRNHRKLIVVDCLKAFMGGLNIANEYSGFHLRRRGRGWRDTGIMLEGPIAYELFKAFKKDWLTWSRETIDFHSNTTDRKVACDAHAPCCCIPVIPIVTNSAKDRRKMRRLLYYSINHARKSISLTTAYFTPSWRMVETLEQAVNRGVKVRLIVPGVSDVPAASYAGKAFFSRLLRAGVEIYLYSGEILHAKSSLFDDCWGIVGSTNLDFQSFRYNDEGNVGILDPEFAAKMDEVFEEDLRHSERIELNTWQKRPLTEKLKEHFYSLFRRRL